MNSFSPDWPLLSVIIATYNRANDLDRCIQGVLAEPGDFFEVAVGDDGSLDHTPQVVESYSRDPRVCHYRNVKNIGMQENYLKLARFARGAYLFILTDDDYLVPGALAKVARVIQAHPEVGYILSDLLTVDERTGKIVDIHRLYKKDTLVAPSLANMAYIVRSAWVLSRQVLKRDAIDWETWERFRSNIFFPIILAGRLLLSAPGYYIADSLVMHTWFNKVYWHAFGRSDLDIEFSLAADRHKCMRAILHNQRQTPVVRSVIDTWETSSLKSYLYLSHLGFYDLIKCMGFGPALKRLLGTNTLNARQRFEVFLFVLKIPWVRTKVNLKAIVRNLPTPMVEFLRSFRNQLLQ